MLNKPLRFLTALRIIFLLFFSNHFIATTLCQAATAPQIAVVEKVLSGDSVRLKGGKTLRYIGVEAYPEQSKIPLVREYGEKARIFNESLVGGKAIKVEWDSKIRDAQNNFLAYVYLKDGRFVNLEILKAGHAKARIRTPNIRHAAEFRQAQDDAHRARLGIWEKEPKDPFASTTYIGEKNTKLYYRPDSPELSRIPAVNLVYFDSRVAAKAAGYRACPSCRESSASEAEA